MADDDISKRVLGMLHQISTDLSALKHLNDLEGTITDSDQFQTSSNAPNCAMSSPSNSVEELDEDSTPIKSCGNIGEGEPICDTEHIVIEMRECSIEVKSEGNLDNADLCLLQNSLENSGIEFDASNNKSGDDQKESDTLDEICDEDESDSEDDWENDDDLGFIVVPISEEDFDNMEEEALARMASTRALRHGIDAWEDALTEARGGGGNSNDSTKSDSANESEICSENDNEDELDDAMLKDLADAEAHLLSNKLSTSQASSFTDQPTTYSELAPQVSMCSEQQGSRDKISPGLRDSLSSSGHESEDDNNPTNHNISGSNSNILDNSCEENNQDCGEKSHDQQLQGKEGEQHRNANMSLQEEAAELAEMLAMGGFGSPVNSPARPGQETAGCSNSADNNEMAGNHRGKSLCHRQHQSAYAGADEHEDSSSSSACSPPQSQPQSSAVRGGLAVGGPGRRLSAAERRRSEITGQQRFQGPDGAHCFFNLKVIFEPYKTGFEESKDFNPPAGTIIAGRYEVVDFLGQAAFSSALQCVDLLAEEDEEQWVCLKVIKNNKDFFDQSLDEIKLLQYINSRGEPDDHHVLRLIDYFYCKEHLFIVSELLKENLYEFGRYIREGELEVYFTLPRLKRIMHQVLEALRYIHSLKLIHCDIKPENIVMKSYSRCEIKLIDFGSSCFSTDHLTTYIQSRSYRAPEVILGHPYDARIDVWSVGGVAAEMFTGYVLFQNESIATMLARITGIMGAFPQHVLSNGKESSKYFTSSHVVYDRQEATGKLSMIFPKKTTLPCRLHLNGFEGKLNEDGSLTQEALFIDFVRNMLHLDPKKRLTAAEALMHPWIADTYDEEVPTYVLVTADQQDPPNGDDEDDNVDNDEDDNEFNNLQYGEQGDSEEEDSSENREFIERVLRSQLNNVDYPDEDGEEEEVWEDDDEDEDEDNESD